MLYCIIAETLKKNIEQIQYDYLLKKKKTYLANITNCMLTVLLAKIMRKIVHRLLLNYMLVKNQLFSVCHDFAQK